MIEVQYKRAFPGLDVQTVYVDKLTQTQYRRIIAGLAWPTSKPGFLVVLAEELRKKAPGHSFVVLAEHQSTDLHELHAKAYQQQEYYLVQRFYGDPTDENMLRLWYKATEDRRIRFPRKQLSRIHITPAPNHDQSVNLRFYAHLIISLLDSTRKRLYLRDAHTLKAHLENLQGDSLDTSASNSPSIAALGYAASALRFYQPPKPGTEESFVPLDPVIGF